MADVFTVKTPRFEMDYAVFGSGKKSLVIIPGMSMKSVMISAAAVESAYSGFCGSHRVYVFDRKRGIEAGYTVENMAQDTAEAMKMLGIVHADIFGASQGGMITQCIAADYPELAGRIALGSTLMKPNPVSADTFSLWKKLADAGDVREANRCFFSRVYSRAYYEKYRSAFAYMESEGTADELFRFGVMAEACRIFDFENRICKIRCPTLVIGAENDEVVGRVGTMEIAEKLGCRMYMYKDYGHAVFDEAPDYKMRLAEFFDA